MQLGIINFSAPSTGGNLLIEIIYWLVNICSSVALGVILFTVILKLITLPFDYISRASMRKNSIKMEEMRPELEKLQKQYADNKDLYNQKMMALYKKNGYSMFGACLPTILTLVIFIVAINAFTDYSKFQNKTYFYNMSLSYNEVAYSGLETDDTYIYFKDGEKFLVVNEDQILENGPSGTITTQTGHEIIYDYVEQTIENAKQGTITLYTTNGFIEYKNTCSINDDNTKNWKNEDRAEYLVRQGSIDNQSTLSLDLSKVKSDKNNNLTVGGKSYNDILTARLSDTDTNNDDYTEAHFLKEIMQEKSASTFRSEKQRFLWVENIWATDSPMAHPIESNWQTFKNTHGYNGNDIGEDRYKDLIGKLEVEKTQPNGYFILIVLTAGISLVMQLVTSKAQKAQMELQTVDGQGAQTQKIMKWMMPIMMAIFAFMYTAAFSLYIITSSVISIGTTYGINFIVDLKMKKEKANKKEDGKIRGRIHVEKEQPKKEEPKKKKDKNDQFAHESGEDFLTGKADKKHVRGRLK